MTMDDSLYKALFSAGRNPAEYYNRFRFTFTAINGARYSGLPGETARLALPSIRPELTDVVLLVAKLRMERLAADAYAVTETTGADSRGHNHLFIYASAYREGRVTHSTDLFLLRPEGTGRLTLYRAPEDDWLRSNPSLLQPNVRYQALFLPFDTDLREVAEYIDPHPALHQADAYLAAHALFSSPPIAP